MTSVQEKKLISQYIERDPNRPGLDNVRIVGHGVHVWALMGYLEGADGNLELVAEWFDLPVEAVAAARAYYQDHKALIDNRIDPYDEL